VLPRRDFAASRTAMRKPIPIVIRRWPQSGGSRPASQTRLAIQLRLRRSRRSHRRPGASGAFLVKPARARRQIVATLHASQRFPFRGSRVDDMLVPAGGKGLPMDRRSCWPMNHRLASSSVLEVLGDRAGDIWPRVTLRGSLPVLPIHAVSGRARKRRKRSATTRRRLSRMWRDAGRVALRRPMSSEG